MKRPHGSLGTTELHELIKVNRSRALARRAAGDAMAAEVIMGLVDQFLDELHSRATAP